MVSYIFMITNIPTFGGLKGYVSGILISSLYFPPEYGVSGGPATVPASSVKSSAT